MLNCLAEGELNLCFKKTKTNFNNVLKQKLWAISHYLLNDPRIYFNLVSGWGILPVIFYKLVTVLCFSFKSFYIVFIAELFSLFVNI